MKYILMDYVNEAGWPQLTKSEQEHWLGAYRAYMEAMTKAGVLRDSNGLQFTSAATTVRIVNDKTQVLDGPYADTKEQLGGFHIIEVADLDSAIAWAARSPTALRGVVEVRPVREGQGVVEQYEVGEGRHGGGNTKDQERAGRGHGDFGKRQHCFAVGAGRVDRCIPGRGEPHHSGQGADNVRRRQRETEPEAHKDASLRQWECLLSYEPAA